MRTTRKNAARCLSPRDSIHRNFSRCSYKIEWIAPASGGVLRTDSIESQAKEPLKLRPSSEHSADIALRIVDKR